MAWLSGAVTWRWVQLGAVGLALAWAAWRRRIGCVASAADAVVYPSTLALLDGAGQRVVPDCAHIELAFSPAVEQWLWQALTSPAGQRPW